MNEKYIENYPSCKPHQCLKQATNEAACYSNFSLNAPPMTSFMDVYMSSQNLSFQQSHSSISLQQQEHADIFIWDGRIPDVEKTIKIPDKITTEHCGKDLSPSYCSNADLTVLDSYKQNANKDMHDFTKFENEWCYNQNKIYPSCAQEKFCNIQNNHNVDYATRNCNYNDMFNEISNMHCKTNNGNGSNEVTLDYIYNYYDNRYTENQSFGQNAHYFTPQINPIDQQTEGSNEESDIVVEESEEEIVDYSEDNERLLFHPINKCIICNIMYTPLGTQFYFLTEENPVTMSTQKPVIQKLVNIVGEISRARNYLCSDCLGYINDIDHLQMKLEKFESDLVAKFRRTCSENNVQCGKGSSTRKVSRINKFPRYRCKLCNKILCLKKYYFYHIKRHRSQSYLCDSCGKIYSNKRKFLLHCKQHKRKSCKKINGFKCSNCKKIFRTQSNRKEHENYCLNKLPFECKQQCCDKKFPSATKLKSHVRLKHDKKFIIICSICNIGFIKMSDYKSHMVSHSTDKKYSCPKCHKNYKTFSNLNFHMKTHKEKLPFNCHICKKGFMRKEYLEAHINNHNGIKNFSCTNCEKKFVSQKNLDAHAKYHEGTVKKNTCNICGKTMTSGFEEHLRIHNDLREFECEQCDMKFNTKGTLSKYVRKKHI